MFANDWNVQEFEKIDNKEFSIGFLEFLKETRDLLFYLHLFQVPDIPTYLASWLKLGGRSSPEVWTSTEGSQASWGEEGVSLGI